MTATSSSTTVNKTLFDRIGGEAVVRNLVDDFYKRVLDDPQLKPFFENTSMDSLRTMQYEFFAAALDGPSKYEGKQLSYVHGGRGIQVGHFARFADRLFDTLEGLHLSREMVHEIIGRVRLYVDEITGGTGDAE